MELSTLQKGLIASLKTGDTEKIKQAEKEMMAQIEKANQRLSDTQKIDFEPKKTIVKKNTKKAAPIRTSGTPLEELIISSLSAFSYTTDLSVLSAIHEGEDYIELHLNENDQPMSLHITFEKEQASLTLKGSLDKVETLRETTKNDASRLRLGSLVNVIDSYFSTHEHYSRYELVFPNEVITHADDFRKKKDKKWLFSTKPLFETAFAAKRTPLKESKGFIRLYGSEAYDLCAQLLLWDLSLGYRKSGALTRLYVSPEQEEAVRDVLHELGYIFA